MAQSRRYHAPGQGGRTGMTVGEDVRSISGYYKAGKDAMDADDSTRGYPDDSASQEYSQSPSRSRKSQMMGRKSGLGSSSMDIENSYAPSPNYSRRTREGYSPEADNNSVIDYGDAADGYDSGEAGPSGRQSLGGESVGRGRNRPSDISSPFDASGRRVSGRPSGIDDSYSGGGYDEMPMDVGGDEMPSFNVNASIEEEEEEEEDDRELLDDSEEAPNPDEDEGEIEDALAQEEEEEEDPEATPKPKRGRPKKADREAREQRQGSTAAMTDEERIEYIKFKQGGLSGTHFDDDGLRKSTRHRFSPLEWWRGERAVYGRPIALPRRRVRDSAEGDEDADDTIEADAFEDAPVKTYAAPTLQSIVKIKRAPGEGTFSGMKLKSKSAKLAAGAGKVIKKRRKRKNSEGSDEEVVEYEPDPTQPTRHPEDGWDEGTEPHGTVWDADKQGEIERRIACPISQVRPKTAINSPFAFEKVFGVDEYMAAGILEIPVGGSKPTKPTKDNNYTFVVLEGAVDVRVHRTMFRVAPEGMFMVPKGNTYSIENCCHRKARIFFAQARQAQVRKVVPTSSLSEAALGKLPAAAVALADPADLAALDRGEAVLQRVKKPKPPPPTSISSQAASSNNPNNKARTNANGITKSGAPVKRGRGRPPKAR